MTGGGHREDQEHEFSADRPIRSRSEDLLARSACSTALAQALTGWRGNDSLVVGLAGNWGIGKSSIKNMAVEALDELTSDWPNKPVLVEFRPWQAGVRGRLTEAFFREIGAKIGHPDRSAEMRRAALQWRSYGRFLHSGGTIVETLRPILAMIPIVAGIAILGVKCLSLTLSLLLIGIVSLALLKTGRILNAIADWWDARATAEDRTPEEFKQKLADALQESPQLILTIVDDIHRWSGCPLCRQGGHDRGHLQGAEGHGTCLEGHRLGPPPTPLVRTRLIH